MVFLSLIHISTALGCALVAAVGAGIYNSYKDAVEEMVKVVKRYTPNEKNRELYEDAYRVWKSIFQDLHQHANKNIAEWVIFSITGQIVA